MKIPPSMQAELAEWNNGAGIDLQGWTQCEGRFALAVGYLTMFWPEYEEIEGYILAKGTSLDTIRGFEEQEGSTRLSVEATLNHIHLVDLQHGGCPDCSPDKLLVLGNALREIYQAKLAWCFPNRPCVVDLYIPEDPSALRDYQLTFWQAAHNPVHA